MSEIMENNEYITVKDFAKMAGISTQRVYQLLAKDLQSYCKEINGAKNINVLALERFNNKSLAKDLQANFNEDLPNNQGLQQELTKSLQEQINDMRKQNELLYGQLAVKDKQIDSLNAALNQAQQALCDTTAALNQSQQALQDTTAALNAAQALHAGTMQQQLTATDSDVEDVTSDTEIKKKGFFSRFFRKE